MKNFPSSLAGEYEIKDENVYINLKKEKETIFAPNGSRSADYNLHFHFGIKNFFKYSKKVAIHVECKDNASLQSSNLKLWGSSDSLDYKQVTVKDLRFANRNQYYFELNLNPEEVFFIANFCPINFNLFQKEMFNISKEFNVRTVSIGKSSLDRDIVAYEYGDCIKNPTILIVSGFHPPEGDVYVTKFLFREILTNLDKDLISKFSFSFIPIVNPDGFALMKQGSNFSDINFHWKFLDNSFEECPEAYYLINYCNLIKPNLFLDFHAYTFQTKKNKNVYVKPSFFYEGKQPRNVYNEIISKIKKDFTLLEGVITYVPTTLHYFLTEKFNTISISKIHVDTKEGFNKSNKVAMKLLKDVLVSYNEYASEDKYKMLKKPHGNLSTSVFNEFKKYLLLKLNWYIRPLLLNTLRRF